jgi:hypothetical protein
MPDSDPDSDSGAGASSDSSSSSSSTEPETDLDVYVDDIRTTVEAATQAGHPENEVRSRLDTLFAEVLDEYDHQIESRDAFAEELDALVRNAYLPADEVGAVLRSKLEELDALGGEAPEFDRLVQSEVSSESATHGDVSVVDPEKAGVDEEDLRGASAEELSEMGIDVEVDEATKSAQEAELAEMGIDPEELREAAADDAEAAEGASDEESESKSE